MKFIVEDRPTLSLALATVTLLVISCVGVAQPAGGPPPFGPGGRGGLGPQELKLVEQFDRDADSRLNREERAVAREHVRKVREAEMRERASGPGRGPGGPGGSPRGRLGPPRDLEPPLPGKKIGIDDVRRDQTSGFYDERVLRTLFIDFENEDWEGELSDFYRTDVEVEARLTVDGEVYQRVGVKFRGNTSSLFVPPGRKKSLGVSIDFEDPDLRLYGYRTLNLLNAHTDPTFLREVLFDQVARQYLPAARANFVRVVINGESWGIYVNSQQFNKDFLADWFDTRKGVRWKVPANPMRGGGLGYFGDDLADYKDRYELMSDGEEKTAWSGLIELSRTLGKTPLDELEEKLDPMLAIDRTLWFMALDNVFIDNDGYWVRASDFLLYQDKEGRFHPIPHDNNETFQEPGGAGFRGGDVQGVELDPLFGRGEENKPFMRLLEVPHLRARYLAHVRTLVKEWLQWSRLQPLTKRYQDLIGDDVKADTRKLYEYAAFVKGVTESAEGESRPGGARKVIGLKEFVDQRGAYLLGHPQIDRPTPVIRSVSHRAEGGTQSPLTTEAVEVTATVGNDVPPEQVYLYYGKSRTGRFSRVAMASAGQGAFRARIPAMPAGTTVRYYVEARSGADQGTTAFHPSGTEFAALTYRVEAPEAAGTPVIISEVMASNSATIADPQNEYDDWIELWNVSREEVDLSGKYLSDKPDNPRKWRFPDGTRLAAGAYLLVWADEDGKATPGLHANFKLSKNGESVSLHDTDARGNKRLDTVQFGPLKDDQSFGRVGSSDPGRVLPKASPGGPNE